MTLAGTTTLFAFEPVTGMSSSYWWSWLKSTIFISFTTHLAEAATD